MRLDAALAARGLARSRTQAAHLIQAGNVTVDGNVAVKLAAQVDDAADIRVTGVDAYVSRAAHKLVAALDAFAVDPSGRVCLDLGASTGGVTQVLRARGAATVAAVDVGHGQLSPVVAEDPGVRLVEGYNVRHMSRASLYAESGIDAPPSLVTADLSFISLALVWPAVAAVAADESDVVALIKPQFEVGRTGVRGGVVIDAALRASAVIDVLHAAERSGFAVRGLIASPLEGTHGNAEYLVHLRRRTDPGGAVSVPGDEPTEWVHTVNRLAGPR
ncbi:TlyA family RNA methyltransferase [Microbacterium sp.]|uniref:TlyA family RNA methyltransferase n=1 Tax=Microbacterium sp. TaxID=51671 RepID=UPI003A89C223